MTAHVRSVPWPGAAAALPARWCPGRAWVARALCLAIAGTALGVLAGWAFDQPPWRSMGMQGVQMKANTAVALLLAATGLLAGLRGARRPWAGPVLGGACAAVGALTVAQYLFSVSFGIDELLVADTARALHAVPGRMSPFTAWALVAFGTAVALVQVRVTRGVFHACVGQVGAIGAVAVLGHAWNAADLVAEAWVPLVAVHTGIDLLLASVALALARLALQAPRRPRRLSGVERRVMLAIAAALAILVVSFGHTYRTDMRYFERSAALLAITAGSAWRDTAPEPERRAVLASLLATLGLTMTVFGALAVSIRGEMRRSSLADRRLARANRLLERKVRERTAELEDATERLRQMTHSLAHDLRQPIISMGCHGQLLEAQVQGQDQQRARHHLERIRAAMKTTEAIGDRLLALSDPGEVPVQRKAAP